MSTLVEPPGREQSPRLSAVKDPRSTTQQSGAQSDDEFLKRVAYQTLGITRPHLPPEISAREVLAHFCEMVARHGGPSYRLLAYREGSLYSEPQIHSRLGHPGNSKHPPLPMDAPFVENLCLGLIPTLQSSARKGWFNPETGEETSHQNARAPIFPPDDPPRTNEDLNRTFCAGLGISSPILPWNSPPHKMAQHYQKIARRNGGPSLTKIAEALLCPTSVFECYFYDRRPVTLDFMRQFAGLLRDVFDRGRSRHWLEPDSGEERPFLDIMREKLGSASPATDSWEEAFSFCLGAAGLKAKPYDILAKKLTRHEISASDVAGVCDVILAKWKAPILSGGIGGTPRSQISSPQATLVRTASKGPQRPATTLPFPAR